MNKHRMLCHLVSRCISVPRLGGRDGGPVIYCRRNQRDNSGVCPADEPTDDVAAADAGDSGADGREDSVKMISDSQVYVLNAGESVVLECYFVAAKYNMFDYPLLWKKVRSPPFSYLSLSAEGVYKATKTN